MDVGLSVGDYKIRAVSVWDGSFWDESDAPFTILGATPPSRNAIPGGHWAGYE